MNIKSVKAYSRDLGTSRPYSIAYKTVTEVINAVVEIELENGIIGIGTANPSPKVVGESVEDTIKTLEEESFEFLVGKDIRLFENLLRETNEKYWDKPGTNVAIDVALHDAFSQFLKVRLIDLYGQKHMRMATSVTIGIKNVEETLKESKEYVDLGFRIIKVKTGLNAEEDAERVIRMQEQHPGIIIRVDANQGYKPADLEKFVALTSKLKLDLIEQPFPVDSFIEDISGLGPREASLLVADESLKNPIDALKILTHTDKCRIFNIKLMKTGGLYCARQIADLAKTAGVKLMWGCNDESAVTIAAALHMAFAYGHTQYIDLDGSLDLVQDVVTGGFHLEDGMMSLTNNLGLGVRIH